MSMVDLDKPVQVLAKEGWHPGVLGIVAGRIMEQISQTVVVLNIEDGLAKGSARSLESINIFHALDDHLYCIWRARWSSWYDPSRGKSYSTLRYFM